MIQSKFKKPHVASTRLASSDFARLLFWRFVLVVKKENWINKKKTNSNE